MQDGAEIVVTEGQKKAEEGLNAAKAKGKLQSIENIAAQATEMAQDSAGTALTLS
jgi:hypothetical protein